MAGRGRGRQLRRLALGPSRRACRGETRRGTGRQGPEGRHGCLGASRCARADHGRRRGTPAGEFFLARRGRVRRQRLQSRTSLQPYQHLRRQSQCDDLQPAQVACLSGARSARADEDRPQALCIGAGTPRDKAASAGRRRPRRAGFTERFLRRPLDLRLDGLRRQSLLPHLSGSRRGRFSPATDRRALSRHRSGGIARRPSRIHLHANRPLRGIPQSPLALVVRDEGRRQRPLSAYAHDHLRQRARSDGRRPLDLHHTAQGSR